MATSDDNMPFEDTHEDAEEIEGYYLMLEAGIIPDLDWKCPGKRTPTPDGGTHNNNKELDNAVSNIEVQEPQNANDFDFNDDVATQPQVRVRQHSTTPKSARKKTANFAGVMETLKKKNAEGAAATT